MSAPVLVCFAVPQEAKPFRKLAGHRDGIRVLVTGMGARNAEQSFRRALEREQPASVFTCGFAGALDPKLRIGDVVYHTNDSARDARLASAGARSVSFCCSEKIAVTAIEKAALRRATEADVVEMESVIISSICSDTKIPCAIVRAISDTADENLPLDFNKLLTADDKLSPTKLALAILSSPARIPALMRLGKNSALAAEQLARVLAEVI